MKEFNGVVNDEKYLIRYSNSLDDKNQTVYNVETAIPNVGNFKFTIENGKAAFVLLGGERDEIVASLINAIKNKESKK